MHKSLCLFLALLWGLSAEPLEYPVALHRLIMPDRRSRRYRSADPARRGASSPGRTILAVKFVRGLLALGLVVQGLVAVWSLAATTRLANDPRVSFDGAGPWEVTFGVAALICFGSAVFLVVPGRSRRTSTRPDGRG
jgi:hypothetical protein